MDGMGSDAEGFDILLIKLREVSFSGQFVAAMRRRRSSKSSSGMSTSAA
jgi:hypothetical protein